MLGLPSNKNYQHESHKSCHGVNNGNSNQVSSFFNSGPAQAGEAQSFMKMLAAQSDTTTINKFNTQSASVRNNNELTQIQVKEHQSGVKRATDSFFNDITLICS